jgi:Fe(3+) dicitrate transport protein
VELAWTVRAGEAFELRAVGYHHWLDRSWTKLNGFAGRDLARVLARPAGAENAVYYSVLTGASDSATDDERLLLGTNQRTFHAFGAAADARWLHRTQAVRQELTLGVRLHADRVRRDHRVETLAMIGGALAETDAAVERTAWASTATALALHLHEDFGIGSLRLLPGVRMEIIRTSDDAEAEVAPKTRVAVLPGFGVHVQPTSWLSVLGGVHRGFSPVAPGQKEDVEPETSWNYEAGARISHRGLQIEGIGFFNDISNLSGTCTQAAGCSTALLDTQFNAGRVHVWGVEATVGYAVRLPEQLRLDLGLTYTYTGSQFRSGFVSANSQWGTVQIGDALPYVPEHRGSGSAVLDFVVGSFGANLTARSAMRDLPGQGTIDELERIPESLLLDLAVTVRITRHVAVYSVVSNVTNSRVMVSRRPFGARPGRPFHVVVGVKLTGRGDRPGIVEAAANR